MNRATSELVAACQSIARDGTATAEEWERIDAAIASLSADGGDGAVRDVATLQWVADNISQALFDSATAGGRGAGLYGDAESSRVWGDVAVAWLESEIATIPTPTAEATAAHAEGDVVRAWIDARAKLRSLTDAYNARVVYARERELGAVSVDAEYQEMCAQQRVVRDCAEAAARELEAAPQAPVVAQGGEALTAAQIEQGWRDTFSTENPFCPCDLKTFTKAVRWAERRATPQPLAVSDAMVWCDPDQLQRAVNMVATGGADCAAVMIAPSCSERFPMPLSYSPAASERLINPAGVGGNNGTRN